MGISSKQGEGSDRRAAHPFLEAPTRRTSDNAEKLHSSKPPPPHSSERLWSTNIWAESPTHHREREVSTYCRPVSQHYLNIARFPAFFELVRCVVLLNSSVSVGGNRSPSTKCVSVIGQRGGAVGEIHSGVKSEEYRSYFPSSISFPPDGLNLCLTPHQPAEMAQRVTLRKRQPYNTTSSRRRIVKTPGGNLRYHHIKKLPTAPKCGDCGSKLNGVRFLF
jgi:hypothetical protein